MKIKLLAFLFIIVIGLMCGSAYAVGYSESENRINIDGTTNLSTLETAISDPLKVTHVGRDWYINCSLSNGGSGTFYITGDEADTVFFGREAQGTTVGQGGITSGTNFVIRDVVIRSYNLSTMTQLTDTGDSYFYYKCENGGGVLQNVTIHGGATVYYDGNDVKDVHDIFLYDVYGFSSNTEGVVIDNFVLDGKPSSTAGITLGYSVVYGYIANDSVLRNIYINGSQGLAVNYCHNVTIENITLDNNQWSSLQLQQGANSIYANNISINNSGHSGIDVHGGYDILITNATINNSDSNGIQVTTSDVTLPSFVMDETTNVTFRDIHVFNAISGLSASANPSDITNNIFVYDSIIDTVTNCFEIANTTGTPGLTIINCTMDNFDIGVKCTSESDGVFAYDSDFRGGSEYDVYVYDDTGDGTVNLINCLADDIYLGTGTQYNKSYYLNALVQNTSAHAVEGAKLEVTQTGFGLDGLSSETYVFYSESDGRFTNGGNRSNYPAIQYLNYDGSSTYYTYNITASKSGQSDTGYAVSLSSYGYSSDLSDLNGTLYTFTLDVPGEGEPIPEDPLSISSSSPSGSTISIYNTSTLTTSITVNKQANISVYLDAVLVQTNTSVTTATYVNDSMSIGTHNLTMLASVGGESVNRVWTVTVSDYVVPSEEETSWQNMRDDTAGTFTSLIGSVVAVYLLSGIMVAYGYTNNKFGINDKVLGIYMKAGLALFIIVIAGVAILQTMDSMMDRLL